MNHNVKLLSPEGKTLFEKTAIHIDGTKSHTIIDFNEDFGFSHTNHNVVYSFDEIESIISISAGMYQIHYVSGCILIITEC